LEAGCASADVAASKDTPVANGPMQLREIMASSPFKRGIDFDLPSHELDICLTFMLMSRTIHAILVVRLRDFYI